MQHYRLILVAVVVATLLGGKSVSSLAATSGKQLTPEQPACETGKVAFRGKCVEKDECCVDDLCPAGMVFEFVRTPTCVPCAEAQTQSGAAYCAGREVDDADKQLNRIYQELVDRFPSERPRLKVAERTWITFRGKFCEAEAGIYKGGSLEKQVFGGCLARETRRQIDRLTELRKAWPESEGPPSRQEQTGRSGK